MAHGFKRSGRAAGAGFYDYDADGNRSLWAGLSVFARGRHQALTDETIVQRLMLVQSVTALKRLAAGPSTAAQIDQDAREGWGYPEALGGPIRQIEQVGQDAFGHACQALAERFGERFKV